MYYVELRSASSIEKLSLIPELILWRCRFSEGPFQSNPQGVSFIQRFIAGDRQCACLWGGVVQTRLPLTRSNIQTTPRIPLNQQTPPLTCHEWLLSGTH